jgi:16S rRNA processing protein RimM
LTAPPAFESLIVIGRLVRPQGRKGEILTEPLSDRGDRFTTLKRTYVEEPDGSSRSIAVTSAWPHKGRVVLKLEGVDSIDDAERLRGRRIGLAQEELAPLPAGSFYFHELRGLRVVDARRGEVGVVRDVWETGAAPVLIVDGPAGETLIPFAESFIRSVEPAQGRLLVELLETMDAAD